MFNEVAVLSTEDASSHPRRLAKYIIETSVTFCEGMSSSIGINVEFPGHYIVIFGVVALRRGGHLLDEVIPRVGEGSIVVLEVHMILVEWFVVA